MERKEKVEVIYKKRAAFEIACIAIYIAGKGYPDTAQKYRKKLYEFGNSLGSFANKYSICRHAVYARRGYYCAVFDKSWVFIYRIEGKQVIIYNIIHAALLS
jgi:plasmid stabilization system protein ParE